MSLNTTAEEFSAFQRFIYAITGINMHAGKKALICGRSYLKKYCLRGTGNHEGTLLIRKTLREQTEFLQINLNAPLPPVGQFDIIFLRNVMIYFDTATKQAVVGQLIQQLRPGGYLCIGHSESLNDFKHTLQLQG